MILLWLALGVVVQAARAVAWHGWTALEVYVEVVLGLAVVAIVAGARADTAKATGTEHRVNELNRRNWTQLWVETHQVGNGGSAWVSTHVNIPAGQATAGSEYEVFIEGEGIWGNQGNREDLEFQIRWGAQQYATCTIAFDAVAFSDEVAFWLRGTVTVKAGGTQVSAQTAGCMWDISRPALPSNSLSFGNSVTNRAFNAAAAGDLGLWAHWLGTGNPAIEVQSYKTRITRRGA